MTNIIKLNNLFKVLCYNSINKIIKSKYKMKSSNSEQPGCFNSIAPRTRSTRATMKDKESIENRRL